MSINKVMITGNLTRDPELRSTASGMAVLQFGMAVNDRRKNNQTGEWEDVPNYVDCTMFGTRAESVARYIGKGSKVAVEGKLHWNQWEARDGSKRSKLDVTVDNIEFMSRNDSKAHSSGQMEGYPMQGQQMPQTQPQPVQSDFGSVYDEDIPF